MATVLGNAGPARGHRYEHAWVELDGYAYDYSNGVRGAYPAAAYRHDAQAEAGV